MGNDAAECQIDRQYHWPKRNIEILRHYSEVSYAIALVLCFVTFALMPPIVVFIPTVAVAALIIKRKRVPEHIDLAVQRQKVGSGRLFVRAASGYDMVLCRAPGLSVLLVPRSMYETVGESGFNARLHHEFGHLKQFDFAVVVALLFFVAVWVMLAIRTLPALLMGTHEPYAGHPDEQVLHQTGTFWLVVYLVIAIAALATLRTVLHQREFLADAYGEIGSEGLVGCLLQDKVRQKLHSVPASLIVRLTNGITHPPFIERLEAVQKGISLRISRVMFSGFALSFVGLLSLLVVVMPSVGSTRWGLLYSLTPLLVLGSFWGVASRRIHKLAKDRAFNECVVGSFVVGLFGGAVLAVGLVWGIELATGIAAHQFNFIYVGMPFWILVSGLVTWWVAAIYRAIRLNNRFWVLEAVAICAVTVSGLTLPYAYAESYGVEVGDLPIEFFPIVYGILAIVLLAFLSVLLAASLLVGFVARRWFSG